MRVSKIVAVLTVCLLVAQAAHSAGAAGWERSIRVEWGYEPPADLTVTEFRLYQDAAKVCTWAGAAIRAGDCKVTLQKSATAFTLEAAFANNTVSPRSAPFTFADFGAGPSILILIGKER